jgi:hypothetical protein
VKSVVLGRSFRIRQGIDVRGNPEYSVEHRD